MNWKSSLVRHETSITQLGCVLERHSGDTPYEAVKTT